jgi:hypothetical protein
MKLAQSDVDLFYKLHSHLLLFANDTLKILNNINHPDEIIAAPVEAKVKLRDALYLKRELIIEFADRNPYNFDDEELAIVRSWQELVRGRFYIFRYLKQHTIFLCAETESINYGVVSLINEFDEIVGPNLPVMVEAALLPFKGRIIYDGLLSSYRIYFGGGIKRRFKESYDEAKAKSGIITSLPIGEKSLEQSDEEKLIFYLKNDSNRKYYQEEIWALTHKSRKLQILYHQERGKAHARSYGKRLRELGFSNLWVAILNGMIVASERTKNNLEDLLNSIVPQDQRELVYIFHLKK